MKPILLLALLAAVAFGSGKDEAIEAFRKAAATYPVHYRKSTSLYETISRVWRNEEYSNNLYTAHISSRGMANDGGMFTYHTDREIFPLFFSLSAKNPYGGGPTFPDSLFWYVHSDTGIAAGKTGVFEPKQFKGTPIPIASGDNLVSLLFWNGSDVSTFQMLISRSTFVKRFEIDPDAFYIDSTTEHSVTAKLLPGSLVKKVELVRLMKNDKEVPIARLRVNGESATGRFSLQLTKDELLFCRLKVTDLNGAVSYSGFQFHGAIPPFREHYFTDMKKTNNILGKLIDSLKAENLPVYRVGEKAVTWLLTQECVENAHYSEGQITIVYVPGLYVHVTLQTRESEQRRFWQPPKWPIGN